MLKEGESFDFVCLKLRFQNIYNLYKQHVVNLSFRTSQGSSEIWTYPFKDYICIGHLNGP